MKIIKLEDWDEFDVRLAAELKELGHRRMVTIRNFRLSTPPIDQKTGKQTGPEVDRVALVKRTGTDRDETSWFWNESEHDYDHTLKPADKKPTDIIYAYSAIVIDGIYKVILEDGEKEWDLTLGQCQEGLLVYDRAKLEKVAPNEYWFKGDPKEALLLVFVLAAEED